MLEEKDQPRMIWNFDVIRYWRIIDEYPDLPLDHLLKTLDVRRVTWSALWASVEVWGGV
jgi:hypothetical protein